MESGHHENIKGGVENLFSLTVTKLNWPKHVVGFLVLSFAPVYRNWHDAFSIHVFTILLVRFSH